MKIKKQELEALAAKNGYRITFHDGVCDLLPTEAGLLPWRNAPMDEAAHYLHFPQGAPAALACARATIHGLDLEHYDVIGDIADKHCPGAHVVLMHAKDNRPLPWCAEYHSAGRYFWTFNDLATYAVTRYGGKRLNNKEYAALMNACREHRETKTPLRDLL